jgi:ribosome biogenesis GTPase / thiamine phosphate phosphatase
MQKGIVIKSTGSWYQVKGPDGLVLDCKIRGKFRLKGITTTNPLAVGDWVDFDTDPKTGKGVIVKIYERRNYIIRKSINLSKQAHILAANVDEAFLVVTLASPKTFPAFIDRFLVSAQAYRIPVTLVFNKTDLYTPNLMDEMENLMALYHGIGYRCHAVSAKTGLGIAEFKNWLTNKVSVISGHSGVGKSTLINTLEPTLNLKTLEISAYHEAGKHTTTFPEMHPLPHGGFIIDTPGIKGFGVVDMEKTEIAHYFPEMFAVLQNCRFYNCTHQHEPGCAVKEALELGTISPSRYRSYIGL